MSSARPIGWHAAAEAAELTLHQRLAFGSGNQTTPSPSALVVWGADEVMIAYLYAVPPEPWHLH